MRFLATLTALAAVVVACSTPLPSPAPRPIPSTMTPEPPSLVMPSTLEEEIPAAVGGTATWCAPTPKYCQNWGRPKLLGAVQSFSYGDKPYAVRVDHGGRHVIVTVVSYCDCGSTLIDLSPAAFEKLAPLWRGRIPVSVSEVGSIPLPATDLELP